VSLESTSWDYIVVGAGSAGCVLANRLSADPANRVLLLEAGGSDKSLFIQMPAATYVNAIGNPRFDWMYPVEPDPTLGGRTAIWPRGKVMGGTSSINGMLYVRGFPQDYDGWRQLGNAGWGWDDVLPLFRRQEDNVRGASERHGAGGPLKVADLEAPHPIARAFLTAAEACGHPVNADVNGPAIEGFAYVQATQAGGWRCSAAKAFVDPVRRRPNLAVSTRSRARRIRIEQGRATGLEADIAGRGCTLPVAGEIILSGGAIASPQLLMLSGIGDPEELRRHGIAVAAAAPQVGRNLQDHPGLAMTWATAVPTYNSEMALWKQVLHGANWLLRGRGPACTPDAHVVGFLRSDPALDLPDIQVHVTPAGYLVAGEGELILKENSFTVIASVCRPRSRGRIGLRSARPEEPPAIHHRLFGDPDDRDRLARGVRRVRAIVAAAPLAGLGTRPLQPAWDDADEARIAEYLTANAGTIYHPAGTCRMGSDAGSVVDPALKVRGVANLRVADASIMPAVTSGNLNAPCMMIGEKAAELVLADRRQGARVH
jgi:choline dehydrogenase